jgi:hypothetical protein
MTTYSSALTTQQAKSLLLLPLLHTKALVMASHRSIPYYIPSTTTKFCLLFSLLVGMASAQLSSTFYDTSCPNALSTIKSVVDAAVEIEARMGASLLRLHFHDCFVNASHLSDHFLSRCFYFYFLSFCSIYSEIQRRQVDDLGSWKQRK